MYSLVKIKQVTQIYSKSSTLATISIFSMQYSLEYVMDGEDFYILMAVIENIIIGKM